MTLTRRAAALAVSGIAALALGVQLAAAQSSPVRVGSTLSLTGPLAGTAQIHKIVGDIYVEQLNKRGGLLGRQVEWVLRDDQSKPDLARTLYEQLVTVDKADLLIGPYGTGTILSAMGVAQRYNKLLIHHTFGLPHLAKYEMQFPTSGLGSDPASDLPKLVFDALAGAAKQPKTIAIVTSKFPSVQYISLGARKEIEKRGIKEALYLEYEFGTRDFGPIASRIKDANADFLWIGLVGLDGVQILEALKKLDYTPPLHFHMFPTPGPLARSAEGKGALSVSPFEEHPPFTNSPVAAELVRAFRERATKANLPDTTLDMQGAISYGAWQTLEAAVTATKSLDDKVLAQWLKANGTNTVAGQIKFDGATNHGESLYRIKQVQDGKWVIVWPKDVAAPGAKLITP